MRIIIDAFGGDYAPDEMIKGAAAAVKEYGYDILLVGNEQTIRERAAALNVSLDKIDIRHTEDVIDMHDEPRSVLKEHRGSSMAVGLQALADGEGDAYISAGSTGALIMGATFLVKRIKGISRCALAPTMPGANGPFMLLDSGANVECRPEMLVQFAHMGSIYYSHVIGDGTPARVGLINIGVEDTKGGELQLEAYRLLKDSDLNFVGNVEAREILSNEAEVLVADGFTGNVVLKLTEGVAMQLMKKIKGAFMTNIFTKLAALIVKKQVYAIKASMDVSEFGGAPLLGVRKPVIKAHGNSDAKCIKNACRIAASFAASGAIDKIAAAVSTKPVEE